MFGLKLIEGPFDSVSIEVLFSGFAEAIGKKTKRNIKMKTGVFKKFYLFK